MTEILGFIAKVLASVTIGGACLLIGGGMVVIGITVVAEIWGK